MELIHTFIDIFLHLDKHLSMVISHYGVLTYLLLFCIIFCETGLVVTPFLPGDSLLFAAGAFAATGSLQVGMVFGLLLAAALLGNSSNYWIGHFLGPKIFKDPNSRLLNRKHLIRTHEFYERYGGKTIIMARFVPIVRTFAPFVAGLGRMTYHRFIGYDVIGATCWVGICVFAGFFFGNIPVVKSNFSLVILAVIALSLVPGLVEYIRHLRRARPL